MRYFFSRHVPEFERVLLVESGSRYLFDDLIPGLYALYKGKLHLDLLTCFAGHPEGFRAESGEVFRVPDYQTSKARRQLLRTLRRKRYGIVGIICAGEPIMTKWKWLVAAAVPGTQVIQVEWPADRYFVETGDYISDISLLTKATGWQPKTTLPEGIAQTVAFYRKNWRNYFTDTKNFPPSSYYYRSYF
mgnify:CR=1 FL=1